MKRADTLRERLDKLFDAGKGPRWSLVDGPGEVVVEEQAKDGLAAIRCRFPEGFRVIAWRHEPRDFWPIASDKNADGAMLVVRPDGALEAHVHVMECKQTVNASEWRKALLQLEWTVTRLLAVAGALHERVERVVLYTAYRKDALSLDESPDAELFKLPLEDGENEIARRDRSWMLTEVLLPGWASPFPHEKVRKDGRGHASVDLLLGR
jgi:hypothetical protein